jgi:hypothetical protein
MAGDMMQIAFGELIIGTKGQQREGLPVVLYLIKIN